MVFLIIGVARILLDEFSIRLGPKLSFKKKNHNTYINPSEMSIEQEDTYERLYKIEECTVCLDPMVSGLAIAEHCGHVMHKECLTSVIQVNGKCPACMADVSEANIKGICFNLENVENNELWEGYKNWKSNHQKMTEEVGAMKNDLEKLNISKTELVAQVKDLQNDRASARIENYSLVEKVDPLTKLGAEKIKENKLLKEQNESINRANKI